MSKIKDCCIGYAVKGWLMLIWLLIVLSGAKILGQSVEPKTDHIKTATCHVKYAKDFTSFELHYGVLYTDSKEPYSFTAEMSTDYVALYDECRAFLKTMISAQIDEAVDTSKADMAKRKDEHFFLRVAKK